MKTPGQPTHMKLKNLVSKRLIFCLGASLMLISLGLAACSSTVNELTPNDVDKARLGSSKAPAKSRIVQPGERPAFPGRAETVLGTRRVKGKVQLFKDTDQATTVSDYSFEIGTDTSGDGAANERAEAQLEIEGLGKHKVTIEQENFPTMSNQPDQVVVKNENTGNLRTYTADQDLFRYTISDGASKLQIETLPDGTWSVDGQAAASPEAVAALAIKSPVLADASVHGLMLLYQIFNNVDKLPVEYLPQTLLPANINGSAQGLAKGAFGDPKPLLKAAIRLKRQQNKPGK